MKISCRFSCVCLILSAILMVSSCRTSEILVQTQLPPALSLPSNIKKISLISVNDSLKGALYAFKRVVSANSSYPVTAKVAGIRCRKDSVLNLDWNAVASIIGNDTNTALVALSGVTLRIWKYNNPFNLTIKPPVKNIHFSKDRSTRDLTNERDFNFFYNEDGTDRILVLTYTWITYDLKTKRILNKSEDDEEPDFDQHRQLTTAADTLTGKSYGGLFCARKVRDFREYYKNGNAQMRKASKLVRDGKWDEAALIWVDQSKELSSRVHKEALFNLALYEEKKGNIDAAIKYAAEARLLKEKRADSYLAVLRKQQVH